MVSTASPSLFVQLYPDYVLINVLRGLCWGLDLSSSPHCHPNSSATIFVFPKTEHRAEITIWLLAETMISPGCISASTLKHKKTVVFRASIYAFLSWLALMKVGLWLPPPIEKREQLYNNSKQKREGDKDSMLLYFSSSTWRNANECYHRYTQRKSNSGILPKCFYKDSKRVLQMLRTYNVQASQYRHRKEVQVVPSSLQRHETKTNIGPPVNNTKSTEGYIL